MDTSMQNSRSQTDDLKARKAHLNALLKLMGSPWVKATTIHSLTANAIKAELSLIDQQLKRRS
ncbi:hypothetical protein [Pseudomonas thivervalensis]|uniref:hypothetical protein n=1 Tax=Pseudomonas thivervalensis TaxID=86265 RepID=UPI003CEF08C0